MIPTSFPDPIVHPNAQLVLNKQNYCWPRPDGSRETPRQMLERVSNFIGSAAKIWDGDPDLEARRIYSALVDGKFIFNTPTMVNAGKPNGQLAACFVLPIDDSTDSIYSTLRATALVQTSGGGTGFSGGRLRSRGSLVGTTGKKSGGSMSTLRLFNGSSRDFITQGSARNGANMWVQPVWHADVEEFVDMKTKDGEINQFNVSVGVTDAFMEAVQHDQKWELYDPKDQSVVKTVSARELWNKIVYNAWRFGGEPGVLFLDTANAANPTPHIGKFEATNPCGEQWLLPYEACTLGHVNVARFWTGHGEGVVGKIDWDGMNEMFMNATRWLDNVVELNHYPLPEIEQMHKLGNRKIGVGIVGFANLLAQAKIPYDSDEGRGLADKIGKHFELYTDKESVALAKVRGSFANFKGSKLEEKFPDGIRNACRRNAAPTGSTAILLPPNPESTGIEPIFGLVTSRNQAGMKMMDVNYVFDRHLGEENIFGEQRQRVFDYITENRTIVGCKDVPEWMCSVYKQANDISARGHVLMQATWQKYIDNSISKTINFAKGAKLEDVEAAYWLAWETGCKGITIYVDGSRKDQPLTVGNVSAIAQTVASDPKSDIVSQFKQLNGHTMDVAKEIVAHLSPEQMKMLGFERIQVDVPATKLGRDRSSVTTGNARKIETGCGNAFVYLGANEKGELDDVLGRLGKSGGCASAFWEALSRLTSVALRHGVTIDEVRKQLTGISCHRPAFHRVAGESGKPQTITSCADGLATALYEYQLEQSKNTKTAPPEVVIAAKAVGGDQASQPVMEQRVGEGPVKHLNKKHMGACPSCGGSNLDHGGGCVLCHSCGYSQC